MRRQRDSGGACGSRECISSNPPVPTISHQLPAAFERLRKSIGDQPGNHVRETVHGFRGSRFPDGVRGIRMTPGAQRGGEVWMVPRRVLIRATVGLAISVPAALCASQFVKIVSVRGPAQRSGNPGAGRRRARQCRDSGWLCAGQASVPNRSAGGSAARIDIVLRAATRDENVSDPRTSIVIPARDGGRATLGSRTWAQRSPG